MVCGDIEPENMTLLTTARHKLTKILVNTRHANARISEIEELRDRLDRLISITEVD